MKRRRAVGITAPPIRPGAWLDRSRSIFRGAVRVGHDGGFLSLPAGSTEIRRTDRMTQFR